MVNQYAYASDFESQSGELSVDDPARIEALLITASRLYDRASQVAPGHWGPVADTAYVFDAFGSDLLYLRDARGWQYHLRAVDTDKVEIDSDLDGDYDYTLDLSDAWLEGYPRNAVTFDEAFTALQFKPTSAATITIWPKLVACVRITGDWGYAAVPEAVRWATVDIAHGLSQRGFSGAVGTDQALQQGEVPSWVTKLVHSSYSRWIPAF